VEAPILHQRTLSAICTITHAFLAQALAFCIQRGTTIHRDRGVSTAYTLVFSNFRFIARIEASDRDGESGRSNFFVVGFGLGLTIGEDGKK
jgi:hypothetical protein